MIHGVLIIVGIWLGISALGVVAFLIAVGLEQYEPSRDGLPGSLYAPESDDMWDELDEAEARDEGRNVIVRWLRSLS